MEEVEGPRGRSAEEERLDADLYLVHSSIDCGAAEAISLAAGQGKAWLSQVTEMETPMQHFHMGNRHQIKDAPPNTWATVDCRDVVTMSELARRGFHLIDMSGEVWTMHREG